VETGDIAAIAALITAVPATITALAALYPALTKGESKKSRRAIRGWILAALVVVLLVFGAGVLLVGRGGAEDADSTTGAAASGTTTVSLQRYRQEVGRICDQRATLRQNRRRAEDARDDRALLAVLKMYPAPLSSFAALVPPSDRAEEHAETLALWNRHSAARETLINAILEVPADRAMDVARRSEEAATEHGLDLRVGQKLNDLAGSECPLPSSGGGA
jgi:hypothetical protein